MYQLREPVKAVQFSDGSVDAIAAMVKAVHPHASYMSSNGSFRAYNGGVDLSMERGQWLVSIGGALAVLSDESFREVFQRVPAA